MGRVNNKEKYKEYDHNYYVKHKRPKSKIGQAELKIADLEAKLAEKENEIKTLICDYESRITKTHELMSWLEHENEELKQQLVETEQKFLEFQEDSIRNEQTYVIELAEKDKEIEKLKLKLDIRAMSLQNINTERIESKRNQTQLAIQELEKVKVNLKDRITMMSNEEHSYLQKVVIWYDICNQVNKQIKELKGEKE